VAQICTHLDGIPLAIELAAARIRHLSPDQIAARLGNRFNLLTGGSRTALPRQQTLRAAMDWSYDAEQHLAVSQELGDKVGITDAILKLGEAVCCTGDLETGRIFLEQSLEMAREGNFPIYIDFALNFLARLARVEGDNTRAKELYIECAQIRRQIGYKQGIVGTLIDLGQILLKEDNPTQANILTKESLVIYRELKMARSQVYCLAGFASVAGIDKQDECAAYLFGATEATAEKYDLKMDDFDHAAYDPIISAVRQQLSAADFTAAWAEGRRLTLEQTIELAQERLPTDS